MAPQELPGLPKLPYIPQKLPRAQRFSNRGSPETPLSLLRTSPEAEAPQRLIRDRGRLTEAPQKLTVDTMTVDNAS